MSRKCIVCGKSIRKRTNYIRFERPLAYRPRQTQIVMGREMERLAERAARPEGHRIVDSHGNITFYTANPPKTKADCQRFTNHTVLAVKRSFDGQTISEFSFWDGETYEDEFFDSGKCAQRQGYASARAGDRWTWK